MAHQFVEEEMVAGHGERVKTATEPLPTVDENCDSMNIGLLGNQSIAESKKRLFNSITKC